MKRSITLYGHRTSVSLEAPFWDALRDISAAEGTTATKIIARIDADRNEGDNLSSAIRVFVLSYFRERVEAAEKSSI
ncbi:MAG: ribbon-helix-helix domain-containing protein [Pseudomonadota bacterium]